MLTEGGIRTPFLVHWKGTIPGGQVYTYPVISLDVAATANALAGLPKDPALDGVNLMPYLTGKNPGAPHDVLFWRWVGQFAIRKGDWKYLTVSDRQYLFNLATDPEEKHNLLSQHPELVQTLRPQLERWTQTLIPSGFSDPGYGRISLPAFDHYVEGKAAPSASPKEKRKGKAKGKAATNLNGADE
jgi:uncharacterized sulfatase